MKNLKKLVFISLVLFFSISGFSQIKTNKATVKWGESFKAPSRAFLYKDKKLENLCLFLNYLNKLPKMNFLLMQEGAKINYLV